MRATVSEKELTRFTVCKTPDMQARQLGAPQTNADDVGEELIVCDIPAQHVVRH
jgi:hypothetical protein